MKAKEYFEKYEQGLIEEAKKSETIPDGAFAKLYIEMYKEMQDLINTRHVRFDRALKAVISEQNDKWNAIERLFIKKYGKSPIKHNGFLNACKEELGK